MDPVVAKEIADRLCGTREPFISKDIQWTKPKRRAILDEEGDSKAKGKRPSTSEQNYTLLMRKRRDDMVARRTFYTAMASVSIGAGVGSGLWFLLASIDHHTTIAAATTGVISIAGISIGRAWANQATQRRALNYEVMLEELKAVLPYLTLSRAERVYCDVLVMLSQFEANLEARKAIRVTLAQLNDLLADSRRLEKQRKSLLPALGSSPVNELTDERRKLEERITESTDEITRGSLNQSLGHISVRMENSRNLELALERINAQQDAIINALTSSQGALARMQVAPSIQTDIAAQEIIETVAEMNRRTVAVEAAVQEVLTLR
jgi:hypothetical protein